jgi:protein dithiol oxidoreductase (disulfide-forming)
MTMLKQVLVAATLLLSSMTAMAQPFQAGTHYFVLDSKQPTSTGEQIEVLEVFSYACPGCMHFETMVKPWKQTKPADAAFRLIPAAFNATWEMFARGYYAAEVLGIADKAHQEVFDAIHKRKAVRTLEDLAKVYAKFGKTEKQFLDAAKSFAVNMKLNRAKQQVPRYGIDGTPVLIVAGKYRITVSSAGGMDKMMSVVNFLIDQERAAKALVPTAPTVAPAAPAKG